jgi:hypothetical protein
MNNKTRLFCRFRKRRTDRLYLVNRCISRVELTRQVIKADIATSLPDFPFLRGSHVARQKIAQEGERGHSARSGRHVAGQFSLLRIETISRIPG